jgi:hypothetical protein
VFSGFSLQFPKTEIRNLDAKTSAVIHTLAYFSLFRHPLRQEELVEQMQFCHAPVDDLPATLSKLIDMNLIGSLDGYYFLAGQRHLVEIRTDRNQRAQVWKRKVERSVRLMSHLPFVDGLALTGSLSKGTQDPDGDIDFLVLARPGRVWTAQLFLSCLGKIRPKSARKLMCPNLIMASDRLSVREKNLFTASEIVTLLPLTNSSLWQKFYRENSWVMHFYPEWVPREAAPQEEPVFHGLRKLLDRALAGRFGDWIERAFANWMSGRIRRGEEAKSKSDPHLRRRWLDSVEIGHAGQRQIRLEGAWRAALNEFQQRHSVRLVQWQWELGNRTEELAAIKLVRGRSESRFPRLSYSVPWRTGPLPSGD